MFRSTPSTRNAKRDRAAALGRLQTAVQTPVLDTASELRSIWNTTWPMIKDRHVTTFVITLALFGFIIGAHLLVSAIPV